MNRPPKVISGIWWCGDYVCDCTQPYIEVAIQNPRGGYPHTYWKSRIWEGSYVSEATTEEQDMQVEELERARKRFGITNKDGNRLATKEEAKEAEKAYWDTQETHRLYEDRRKQ